MNYHCKFATDNLSHFNILTEEVARSTMMGDLPSTVFPMHPTTHGPSSKYEKMKWRANMASLSCEVSWVPTQEDIAPSLRNQFSRLGPILNPKVRSIKECFRP